MNSDTRSNLKSHEFLNQQLASIRNLNLSDVSRVLAGVAFKSLLRKVTDTHETTLLTDVNAIVVTDIEKALFQETCCSMRYHAITLHLSES